MTKSTVVLCLILISCRYQNPAKPVPSWKDSIVRNYLQMVDTSESFYDTNSYEHKILRAYVNNDSLFFKEMKRSAEKWQEELKRHPADDWCVHQSKLSDLKVDEAYRFTHQQSFCPYAQIITLTRKDKIIQLHYLEFSPDEISDSCFIVKEFDRTLQMEQWDTLKIKLRETDFWGMKPFHYDPFLDGSSWRIDAYTKEPKGIEGQQTQSVKRHCPCTVPFHELGKYFLKLAGIKTSCGDIF